MSSAYEGLPAVAHNQVPGYPEGLPQPGLFNVAAMSDHRAVRLGLGLYKEMRHQGNELSDLSRKDYWDAVLLFQSFGADMAHLAVTDPDRGRPLLMRLAQSNSADERYLAIQSAVPLCVQDYELASEVFLTAAATIREAVKLRRAPIYDLEGISGGLLDMMNFLPAEQAQDLARREHELSPDEG